MQGGVVAAVRAVVVDGLHAQLRVRGEMFSACHVLEVKTSANAGLHRWLRILCGVYMCSPPSPINHLEEAPVAQLPMNAVRAEKELLSICYSTWLNWKRHIQP